MELDKYFPLKTGSTAPQNIYLGVKVSKVVLTNGIEAQEFSYISYLQESVKNVEDNPKKHGMKLSVLDYTPISTRYLPELYATPEMSAQDSIYLQ